ncbi:MAG: hypothetical protein V1659_04285 [Candidatus Woesearchaeota archaeon]
MTDISSTIEYPWEKSSLGSKALALARRLGHGAEDRLLDITRGIAGRKANAGLRINSGIMADKKFENEVRSRFGDDRYTFDVENGDPCVVLDYGMAFVDKRGNARFSDYNGPICDTPISNGPQKAIKIWALRYSTGTAYLVYKGEDREHSWAPNFAVIMCPIMPGMIAYKETHVNLPPESPDSSWDVITESTNKINSLEVVGLDKTTGTTSRRKFEIPGVRAERLAIVSTVGSGANRTTEKHVLEPESGTIEHKYLMFSPEKRDGE